MVELNSLKCLLIVCSLYFGVDSTNFVNFQYDDEQCFGQLVEYQCTVTGAAILRWRILNGSLVVSSQLYSDSTDPEPLATTTVGGVEFTVERLDNSPIISIISFTVQSSINGYTIQCVGGGETKQFNISITDPPAAPETLSIHEDSFTSSSVFISWTDSSSINSTCFDGYRYNVSSDALNNNIVMSTTNTSAVVNSLIPSDYLYNVEVFAVDIANRLSSDNDEMTFYFNIPPEPEIGNIFRSQISNKTANITVRWMLNYDVGPNVITPETTFIVIIYNTTEDINDEDEVDSSLVLPDGSTQHTFVSLSTRENYTIEVMAMNGVGNSSSRMAFLVDSEGMIQPTTTTSSLSSSSFSSSSSSSFSVSTTSMSISVPSGTDPSVSVSKEPVDEGNNVAAIAGGTAGGIIFLALIVVVVLFIVIFYLKKKSESVNLNEKTKPSGVTVALADQDPEIGTSLYEKKHADSSVSPDQPDGNGQPQGSGELATYQDPTTIKREQAPTGDMYAVPDRKPLTGDSSATVQNYAELDLPNKQKQDQSPSGEPPVVVNLGTQQPVEYAELRNL